MRPFRIGGGKASVQALGKRHEEWHHTRRFVVGLFVAYAILIQVLASPVLRAKATVLAQHEAQLAALCLSERAPGHDEPGQRKMPHGHGLECCLPGLRLVAFDAPTLVASVLTFEPPADAPSLAAEYALPRTRAPPGALMTVLQPRAPPVSIV